MFSSGHVISGILLLFYNKTTKMAEQNTQSYYDCYAVWLTIYLLNSLMNVSERDLPFHRSPASLSLWYATIQDHRKSLSWQRFFPVLHTQNNTWNYLFVIVRRRLEKVDFTENGFSALKPTKYQGGKLAVWPASVAGCYVAARYHPYDYLNLHGYTIDLTRCATIKYFPYRNLWEGLYTDVGD